MSTMPDNDWIPLSRFIRKQVWVESWRLIRTGANFNVIAWVDIIRSRIHHAIDDLANGRVLARGCNLSTTATDDIDRSLWRYYLERNPRDISINIFGRNDGIFKITPNGAIALYHNVKVAYVTACEKLPPQVEGGTTRPGRPPHEGWAVAAALACHIAVEEDFPPKKAAFLRRLEQEIDIRGIAGLPEHYSLDDFCAELYKFRRAQLRDG